MERPGLAVFHVKHPSVRPGATFLLPGTTGVEVQPRVRPREGERVLEKNFRVTLLGDACATRTQSHNGETIPARQVHAAFLATLNGFYAKVISAREL
jgi:hypothetical protein